tara:strand:- start:54102 stop:54536 length:435 start_codon:yes stop_codon:yes gene_type:complete
MKLLLNMLFISFVTSISAQQLSEYQNKKLFSLGYNLYAEGELSQKKYQDLNELLNYQTKIQRNKNFASAFRIAALTAGLIGAVVIVETNILNPEPIGTEIGAIFGTGILVSGGLLYAVSIPMKKRERKLKKEFDRIAAIYKNTN